MMLKSKSLWVSTASAALLISICALALLQSPLLFVNAKEDLYKLLGVKSTATTKEIKTAYRRKALDTHPDKNRDDHPDVAAAKFHKIVEAFEILSDYRSRKRYDSGSGGGASWKNWKRTHNNNNKRKSNNNNNNSARPPSHRSAADITRAQSRLGNIFSLKQLKDLILDDDGIVKRCVLMCFVPTSAASNVEKIVDNEILFPYPFFGNVSPRRVWWEDILQSMKVRYHSNDGGIQRIFNISHAGDTTEQQPTFVFVKGGQKFHDDDDDDTSFSYKTLSTTSRNEFQTWVRNMLKVHVRFKNEHTHPVKIYLIDGNEAHLKGTIQANGVFHYTQSMLSHMWLVRDARVDVKHPPTQTTFTTQSSLGTWKILNFNTKHKYTIRTKCFDMSTSCKWWSVNPSPGECQRKSFMSLLCKRTCGFCNIIDKEEE